jgi:hypothetical protein
MILWTGVKIELPTVHGGSTAHDSRPEGNSITSCSWRLIQPARIGTDSCHGCRRDFNIRSGCCVQRGSIRHRWAACQPSKTAVASATCGSAEFLYHTGLIATLVRKPKPVVAPACLARTRSHASSRAAPQFRGPHDLARRLLEGLGEPSSSWNDLRQPEDPMLPASQVVA